MSDVVIRANTNPATILAPLPPPYPAAATPHSSTPTRPPCLSKWRASNTRIRVSCEASGAKM